MSTTHTQGPWTVMADPTDVGPHHFHDSRWIATAGFEVEVWPDRKSFTLTKGSLICQMRDGPPANARLIAAAPELLAMLEAIRTAYDNAARHGHAIPSELVRAIGESAAVTAKAKGEASA